MKHIQTWNEKVEFERDINPEKPVSEMNREELQEEFKRRLPCCGKKLDDTSLNP